MKDSVNIYYNVSKTETCLDWQQPPPDSEEQKQKIHEPNFENICTEPEKISNAFSWGPLTCNDNIGFAFLLAQGTGRDMYWPPLVPRGSTKESILGPRGAYTDGCAAEYAKSGLYGVPAIGDNWALWLKANFGGTDI